MTQLTKKKAAALAKRHDEVVGVDHREHHSAKLWDGKGDLNIAFVKHLRAETPVFAATLEATP